MDLPLNASWDLDIQNNDVVLTSGTSAIDQNLKQRLQTFMGEYFLNKSVGVPYFQHILIKNFDPVVIDTLIKNEIVNTPGILELLEFSLDFEPSTRTLSLSFRARTAEEVISYEGAIP